MSCAFSQPPTLGFASPLGLLALVGLPTPPMARASVALPGVPPAPTLGLAVPVPPVPALPSVSVPRASVTLPGVPAVPSLGIAASLGIIALLAWLLSLPSVRNIPCPLD